jgi:cytochrome c oxidase subunit I+III
VVSPDDRHERLSRIWAPPPGILGFFTAVNHRVVGMRFMVTAFGFFLVAGVIAVLMRLQVSLPFLGVLSPDAYNQAFTMHGSTMMFLFVIPFLEGLGIYLVPLMIGAREMAFPRLNAFGYWVFLIAGVSLYVAYLAGYGPDSGWYNYPPLTGRGFRPGANIDVWVTLITFLEVSALVAAVEIVATILKHRSPGMTLNRIPVFVWAMLITSLMIIFAMPALILTSLMLGLDRIVGTHFFDMAAGGDPFLWQHLFWFFGHPDVYIMLLPGVGAVSMMIPAFVRRPLAGYLLFVVSMLVVGVLSFGVWVHHMYTVGLAMVGLNFFAAASMLITIPSAIWIFSWILTTWRGSMPALTTAMLFALGFVIMFILGGITGIMIAAVPFNWQVHDTQFIVAHFHYTMVGGVVLPIFASVYYWFPKFTGRMLDERLGRWHFWLFLVGFNVTFLLMHLTGIEGMPRRVYTYLPGLGWEWLNVVSTVGAFIMGIGTLVFLWNVVKSWRGGPVAGPDPWGGRSLEWATASPPENYNFLDIPVVRGLEPVRGGRIEGADAPRPAWLDRLAEAPEGWRETLVTGAVTAEPQGRAVLPTPSPWPFWTAMALSVAFLGAMWTPWLVPVGLGLAFACVVGWHMPELPAGRGTGEADPPRSDTDSDSLPWRLTGFRSPITWGVLLLVAIEVTLLLLFVVSYFYLRLGTATWPPAGTPAPSLLSPTVGQLLLVASLVPAWLGFRGLRRGRVRHFLVGVPVGLGLAAGYLVLKAMEYAGRDYRWDAHAYGSLDWTMGGYAALHVVILLLTGATFWARAVRGRVHRERRTGAAALLIYWAFVVAGSLLFWAPQYLGGRW